MAGGGCLPRLTCHAADLWRRAIGASHHRCTQLQKGLMILSVSSDVLPVSIRCFCTYHLTVETRRWHVSTSQVHPLPFIYPYGVEAHNMRLLVRWWGVWETRDMGETHIMRLYIPGTIPIINGGVFVETLPAASPHGAACVLGGIRCRAGNHRMPRGAGSDAPPLVVRCHGACRRVSVVF